MTNERPKQAADPVDAAMRERRRTSSFFVERVAIAIWICAGLSIGFAMYFASTLLVPLAVTALAYLSLRPFVNRLVKLGIPAFVSAASIVLMIALLLAIGVVSVIGPAQAWINDAPANIAMLREKLETLRRPFVVVNRAEEQLESISSQEEQDAPVEVEVTAPSMVDQQFSLNNAGRLAGFLVGVALLTFFLLATGDELLNRLLHVLPSFGDQRRLMELILDIQNSVGHYLGTITLINLGLGMAVSLAMWLVGMPTPILWGVMATCFNFIPYLGALAGAIVVFFSATIHFDSPWQALITVGVFLTLTSIEGNLITPSILGRTLSLGPAVVLLAITFWGFLWGIAGIFLAVPLLLVIRLCCTYFEPAHPIAVLLGEEAAEAARGTAEDSGTDARDPDDYLRVSL